MSSNRIEEKSSNLATTTTATQKPAIKKKLAFSDDEILNDTNNTGSNKSNSNKSKQQQHLKKPLSSAQSDFETDFESNENLSTSYTLKRDNTNDSFDNDSSASNKHKRSSSLTKSAKLTNYTLNSGISSARSNRSSTNMIYDYKPIYEAFEKPIIDAENKSSSLEQQVNGQNYNNRPTGYKTIASMITSRSMANGDQMDLNNGGGGGGKSNNHQNNHNNLNNNNYQQQYQNGGVRYVQQNGSNNSNNNNNGNYIDKEKIAAAAAAASAAAAALEKEKEAYLYAKASQNSLAAQKNGFNQQHSLMGANNQPSKMISNFYNLSKSQIEFLPVSWVENFDRILFYFKTNEITSFI